MTVTTTKAAVNIREQLGQIKAPAAGAPFHTFEFAGDGSIVAYEIAKGWTPCAVYDAGVRQAEGTGDDYATSFDGFVHTVTFAVAPTNLNVVLIDAWRALT